MVIYNVGSGTRIQTVHDDQDVIQAGAWTPDARGLLAVTTRSPALWDAATGEKLHSFENHSHHENVRSLTISADGRRALSVSDDRAILWDMASGRQLNEIAGEPSTTGHPSGWSRAVALSPDGKRILVRQKSDPIVLDAASGDTLRRFGADSDYVTKVAVTADSRRLLVALGDASVVVWNLELGMVERRTQAIE